MIERKPAGVTFETWVDKQIRTAAERGEFDNLPGAGKPIPDHGNDEMWWLRGYIQREGLSAEALLPVPLQLRKEIDRLPETIRPLRTEQAVREVVDQLNQRIVAWLRAPFGPQVPIRRVDADLIVREWKAARPESIGTTTPPSAHGTQHTSAGKKWWRGFFSR